jgi:aminoglycoside phosphotransferase (APT) family kinase protein
MSLLSWIEGIGNRYGDSLDGSDAVHFDYHLGNVLVDPDRPEQVEAIVDWDGAASGHGGFDLVTMYLVVGPGVKCEVGAGERLWRRVTGLPQSELLPSWAHLSLRMVDWAIRFRR